MRSPYSSLLFMAQYPLSRQLHYNYRCQPLLTSRSQRLLAYIYVATINHSNKHLYLLRLWPCSVVTATRCCVIFNRLQPVGPDLPGITDRFFQDVTRDYMSYIQKYNFFLLLQKQPSCEINSNSI